MLSHDEFLIAALVEAGMLSRDRADMVLRHAQEKGIEFGEAVVALGVLTARQVAIARAETSEHPYIDLALFDIDFRNTALLPRGSAESLRAFPLFVLERSVTVGMENPLDLRAVDQLRALLKADIDPVLCEQGALRALIDRAYSLTGNSAGAPRARDGSAEAQPGTDDASDAREPIVAAVNQIIAQGLDLGASDIHLGPDEHELHLRYRVDGALRSHQGPGLAAHTGLIQRLKVMANLDLTQTRRPQDGKFRFAQGGRSVDVRLSIIPTVCGENAVLRLLASGANIKDFPTLGFPAGEAQELERIIENPYGMILVTGPTGSGKTTTLYTALKRLNTPDRNIMTIEDPVEVRMPLVRQVQVNPEIGLNFAGALRSILRQDPDVVFVGEIRDEETARISVQAALTGHLVLSSLHTNDAAGAVPRLRDLNCPAFAVNAALLCVIAQRLVRRTCPDCARAATPKEELLRLFGAMGQGGQYVQGSGCGRCGSTGYRGRIGVYEMLRTTDGVRAAIEEEASSDEIRRRAVADGMRLMWQNGLEKARIGLTTLEEVARVVAVQSTAESEDTGERDVVRRLAA
ncbi:MAG: Flp pilus assembly complex ATPase component TadA [Phycisphaeraceae bacterium]|nr:Flp pilus assembly complex ATPase component TadA [Phycisphaeraceae bacterium]